MKGKANKWYAMVVEKESNRRRRPTAWIVWFFFFIPKPNWFGLIQVGWFKHTKTKNQTELDIFLNILTGPIGFFTGLVFSVNFFSIFSIKSIFWFFFSPLEITIISLLNVKSST